MDSLFPGVTAEAADSSPVVLAIPFRLATVVSALVFLFKLPFARPAAGGFLNCNLFEDRLRMIARLMPASRVLFHSEHQTAPGGIFGIPPDSDDGWSFVP